MFAIIILCLLATRAFADAPVTFDIEDTYKGQRECAFDCFKPLSIATKLSCPTALIMNDCICRTDLQYTANRYISSCVNNWCKEVAYDVSLATKIYDDYCTSNGYIVQKAQVTPTTNTAGVTTSTPENSPTSGSSSSTGSKTSGSSSSGTGLSSGEYIGIIIGAISAVGTIIGVIYAYKTYKRNHNQSSNWNQYNTGQGWR